MRIPQLHLVFVEEIFGDCALDSLSVVELQREALHLSGASGDVTDAILSSHGTAMCDLDLEPLDFLSEFDTLRISQRLALVIDVADIKNFTHELNDGLGLVECCC